MATAPGSRHAGPRCTPYPDHMTPPVAPELHGLAIGSALTDTRTLPLDTLRGSCPDALGRLGITPAPQGERLKVSAFQASL